MTNVDTAIALAKRRAFLALEIAHEMDRRREWREELPPNTY